MIFEVKNASYSYNNKDFIFKNISFSISSGEILTILGRNGIGKTTLLKSITGIFPLKEGSIYLNNKELSNHDNSYIGYVPQARALSFPYTVEEVVLMGRSRHIGNFSVPNDKDYEIVADVLEKVGISSLASKKVTNISGGQLQLVLIARALASEPQLLVMDEPESYLDFKNQYTMLSMIRTIVSDTKLACIMNTHYPAHALQISDKTLMMKPRNHIFGSTKDIVTEHNLNDYFEVQSKIITDNENSIPYSAFVVLGAHK